MLELSTAKQEFARRMQKLQETILDRMLSIDPTLEITKDSWDRKDFEGLDGGGGLTCACQGELFEKAGVNFSQVYGAIDPKFASSLRGEGSNLWASGLSLIIHPRNPKVPTVHANFRMIVQGGVYWFGGGVDLTPFYPHVDDFKAFHQVLADYCAPYNVYDKFKSECDTYFTNHHRGTEMRGIGGIFFDHFHELGPEGDHSMALHLSESFIPAYFPIVERRRNEAYSDADEDFQLHRRGRYVEFNLIHDRGTLFGLKTNGRIESILISMPPRCRFSYQYAPQEGSPHAEMMAYYQARDWI